MLVRRVQLQRKQGLLYEQRKPHNAVIKIEGWVVLRRENSGARLENYQSTLRVRSYYNSPEFI